jgi:hypothetical protein
MAIEDVLTQEAIEGFVSTPFGLGLMLFIIMLLFGLAIGVYVYVSLAHVAIAKKSKHKNPGLAWIPLVGPLLISSQIAKMHWWPLLLLPLTVLFIGFPFIALGVSILFAVFSTIWEFKMFEVVKKPGWWAIFTSVLSLTATIPSYLYELEETPFFFDILSYTAIIFWLVFIGIAAWSKK